MKSAEKPRICPNCGTQQEATALHCAKCGTQLTLSLSNSDLVPELRILPDKGEPFTVRLDKDVLQIGSDSHQDIVVPFVGVAGHMGRFVREGNEYLLFDLTAYPGDVLVNGQFIECQLLKHGDSIRLQDGMARGVSLTYLNPLGRLKKVEASSENQFLRLDRLPFSIGRCPESALCLESFGVSWDHASIVKHDNDLVIEDLDTTNGTYVNDRRIRRSQRLSPGDVIRIDQTSIVYRDNGLLLISTSQRYALSASDLGMTYRTGWLARRKSLNVIRDVDVSIDSGELVAIIGSSGSGKSTVLRSLCGASRATDGQILLNGEHFYENYEDYQGLIGYVPQTDIVHDYLTVYESLLFGARFRFPNEPPSSHEQRVMKALTDLELTGVQDNIVGKLSGGQKKRVSIALELLADPSLLFMDEPSSGLDPGLDRAVMTILRRLANRGKAVLIVTHTPLNIGMCDKLIVMSQGYLVYSGKPKDALAYFGVRDFPELYIRGADSPSQTGEHFTPQEIAQQWAALYKSSQSLPVVTDKKAAEQLLNASSKDLAYSLKRGTNSSFWTQARLLTARAGVVTRRDWFTLVLMLIILPVIALLLGIVSNDSKLFTDPYPNISGDTRNDCLEAGLLKTLLPSINLPQDENPASPSSGECLQRAVSTQTVSSLPVPGIEICPEKRQDSAIYAPSSASQRLLFIMSLATFLLGVFAASYVIVEEKSLFRRERMANLRIGSYLASKLIVLGGLSLLSCFTAILILSKWVTFPEHGLITWAPLEFYITLALTSFAGIGLGLLVSAFGEQINSVIYVVLAVLFLQILLSGVLFEMRGYWEIPSRFMATRWSLEALGGTSFIVARDEDSRAVFRDVRQSLQGGQCNVRRVLGQHAYSLPSSLSVTYAMQPSDLYLRWGVLLGFAVAFVCLSGVVLKHDSR